MLSGPGDDLRLEREGRVAFLTFNRPDARNAMTFERYDGLHDACEELDRDAGVRVLVIRGAGDRSFAAGTDIRQFSASGPARMPSATRAGSPACSGACPP